MGNFNKGKKFGGWKSGKKFGGGSFGGNRGGNRGFRGGRDGGRPEMHKAVCSNCGNDCEVPFRPTGDKPIFCNDCFKKMGNRGNDNPRNFRDGGNRGFDERKSGTFFDGKSSYQSGGRNDSQNYKAQFEILNSKLDKILKTLAPVVSAETNEAGKPKTKKFDKSLKKEVDITSLRKVLTETMDKKPSAKKDTAVSKAAAKKKKKVGVK
jgi:CxxC-x17-CxxC domain-containing protein